MVWHVMVWHGMVWYQSCCIISMKNWQMNRRPSVRLKLHAWHVRFWEISTQQNKAWSMLHLNYQNRTRSLQFHDQNCIILIALSTFWHLLFATLRPNLLPLHLRTSYMISQECLCLLLSLIHTLFQKLIVVGYPETDIFKDSQMAKKKSWMEIKQIMHTAESVR